MRVESQVPPRGSFAGAGGAFGFGMRGAASVSEPSLKFGASAFEAAPVVSIYGRPMGLADIGPIVNESLKEPLGSHEFNLKKDTMPYIIGRSNTIEQLTLEPNASLVRDVAEDIARRTWTPIPNKAAVESRLNTADILAEAQSIIFNKAEVTILKPKSRISSILKSVLDQLKYQNPNPTISQLIDIQPNLQSKVADQDVTSRTGSQVLTQPLTQPLFQEELEQPEEVQETKLVEDQTEDAKEEIERVQKKHVVDEKALFQVISESIDAVRKAKEIAQKLGIQMTGQLVDSYIPNQHPGNESEVVAGKGVDGTIPERKNIIKNLGAFASQEQAEKAVVDIVLKLPPIKIREKGEQVNEEVVQTVYKSHIVKPDPVTIFETRTIKKRTLLVQIGQKVMEAAVSVKPYEGTVEDLNLGEVLKLAA